MCIIGFAGVYQVVNPSTVLNLNFEERTQDGFPINWYTGGVFDTIAGRFLTDTESGFSVTLDSTTRHYGKYSLLLETLPGGNWGNAREDCIEYFDTLLKHLRGKTVTYSGWIKTQNVSDWAGLWWRVDGPAGMLAYKSMQDRAIKGTRDWQQYSFTIPVSDSAVTLDFGVWLASSHGGKAWFDNLWIDTNGAPFAR
jgi:hypothetical protein